MNEIVKFALVENKIDIENYLKYVEEKINVTSLEMQVELHNCCIDRLDISEEVSIENSNECYAEFCVDNEKYFVGFSFETFNQIKQLEISINNFTNNRTNLIESSSNNKETFLERFKVSLKNNILYISNDRKSKAWGKCIWLIDKQSKEFATKLYPMIYETENLYRELLNQVMVKVFGADWWDKVVPKDLKDNQRSKVGTYKSIVQSLNDVDEVLMSIDVSDLSKLTKLKLSEWKLEYNQELTDLIKIFKKEQSYKKIEGRYLDKAIKILTSQLNDTDDLWEKYFSQFLPSDFFEKFGKFSTNRNHIAHNKVIDRQAYNIIKDSIDDVKNDLVKALEDVNSNIRSLEKLEIDRLEKEYNLQEEEEFMREIMESESGVEIRTEEEIYMIFEDAIIRLHQEVEEQLRFRLDIEVGDFKELSDTTDIQSLFNIKHLVTEEEIAIDCEIIIDTAQGGESVLKIIFRHGNDKNTFHIPYINGEVSYNEEQCNYMSETEDEFGERELEETICKLIDFVNVNLESLREKVDNQRYRLSNDCKSRPIADIACHNCGENYICIDENYAKFGCCLNCGEMNQLDDCEKCEKCEKYCDETYKIGKINVCEECYKILAKEDLYPL